MRSALASKRLSDLRPVQAHVPSASPERPVQLLSVRQSPGVPPQPGPVSQAPRVRQLQHRAVPRLGLATWRGVFLKACEPHECVLPRGAAHLGGGCEAGAEGRACRAAEYLAAILLRQLDAPFPRWFPARHAWNEACDGGGDAARTAVGATLHVTALRTSFPAHRRTSTNAPARRDSFFGPPCLSRPRT